MKRLTSYLCFASLLVVSTIVSAESSYAQEKARPPFHGTIFLSPSIITEKDPTTFEKLEYQGQEERRMFDRRTNGWISDKPYLFQATYSDKLSIEFQVNSEFKSEERARELATEFAEVIGRLPRCLRTDVKTSWIHDGNKPFGGGNNNLLIHIDQAENYKKSGILEETLVHEASHTSLDSKHARAAEWVGAQQSDENFISNYAMENPKREDVAETFLLWMAMRHRPDSLKQDQREKIEKSIPNRLKYLDQQKFELAPLFPPAEKDAEKDQ